MPTCMCLLYTGRKLIINIIHDDWMCDGAARQHGNMECVVNITSTSNRSYLIHFPCLFTSTTTTHYLHDVAMHAHCVRTTEVRSCHSLPRNFDLIVYASFQLILGAFRKCVKNADSITCDALFLFVSTLPPSPPSPPSLSPFHISRTRLSLRN